MFNATFCRPDLTTFLGLADLGLEAIGLRLEAGRAVIECVPISDDSWCHRCGCRGVRHGVVDRWLAHIPLGWRPTMLLVRLPRYRCRGCGCCWRHDLELAAGPRAKMTRAAVCWGLEALVVDRLSISRIAAALGVAWDTANTAILDAGQQLLIEHPGRLNGVEVLGVDEHVWRHTRLGDKYVTVIIDLTPVRDGSGSSRLLAMIPGRSKAVFRTWLDQQSQDFRQGVEIVAMDGFTGFKTAAAEAIPDAVTVMDPFHVVKLAADALDATRQRVQQEVHGHRGRKHDALYQARRLLHTGLDLLRPRQIERLEDLFACDDHVGVEVTWSVYQQLVSAYRSKDATAGKASLARIIESLAHGVPKALPELARLGRTLNKRRSDVLAFFDHPGTSNGPTEAINGRLEHLRGTALGFRNLTNYIRRAILDTGGFRPAFHR
ncbi:ISL3 family transposase [Cutibacterium avidum]|uniref:ISL3 family transposase n=2 Tax=Cutibacterium avidum TaxID=33010 RepID=UPI00083E81F2|nr:ISL3 family transposase [Cutibacterium avidum]AOG27549.1 transposase [Cutibacterium avidum]